MKTEEQVCSLELAKKLRDLGLKQDGYFCYYGNNELDTFDNANQMMCGMLSGDESLYISPFTVAELGEMLKSYCKHEYITVPFADDWSCIRFMGNGQREKGQIAKTEADARAKMLIYLLENKLMEK